MKNNKLIQNYLYRASGIVRKMRSLGETTIDQKVAAKYLRSLRLKFDFIVATIEESKDLTSYTLNELMGSLLTHEEGLSRNVEKHEEKAFHVARETFNRHEVTSKGRGPGYYRGKGGRNTQVMLRWKLTKSKKTIKQCLVFRQRVFQSYVKQKILFQGC